MFLFAAELVIGCCFIAYIEKKRKDREQQLIRDYENNNL